MSSQTLTREFGTALLLVPSAGVPKIAEAGELEEAILARVGDLVSKGLILSSFIVRRPGGWSRPLFVGMVLRCELASVAFCGLSPGR